MFHRDLKHTGRASKNWGILPSIFLLLLDDEG